MSAIGISINQITVFDANGITIFTKNYKQAALDHALVAAFFSAVRQFAANMMKGEIQGIKIGSVMLNFKLLPHDQDEGNAFIFLMVSEGFSEASAAEIADNFAETFAIHFDEFLQEKGATFAEFQDSIYHYLNDFGVYFEPTCDEMVSKQQEFETISLDLPIKVPSSLLTQIYDILNKNPTLQSIYENGSIDVLVEFIQNYIYSSRIAEDIAKKYGLPVPRNSLF
jgi:hypothetical protein